VTSPARYKRHREADRRRQHVKYDSVFDIVMLKMANVVDDKNCAAMRESVDWETEYGGYDHVS
jgi:hypothetical protein